jgi:hypothetical protein
LPDYLIDIIYDKNQFIGEIKSTLSHNPSYIIGLIFAPLSGFTAEKGKSRMMRI